MECEVHLQHMDKNKTRDNYLETNQMHQEFALNNMIAKYNLINRKL